MLNCEIKVCFFSWWRYRKTGDSAWSAFCEQVWRCTIVAHRCIPHPFHCLSRKVTTAIGYHPTCHPFQGEMKYFSGQRSKWFPKKVVLWNVLFSPSSPQIFVIALSWGWLLEFLSGRPHSLFPSWLIHSCGLFWEPESAWRSFSICLVGVEVELH